MSLILPYRRNGILILMQQIIAAKSTSCQPKAYQIKTNPILCFRYIKSVDTLTVCDVNKVVVCINPKDGNVIKTVMLTVQFLQEVVINDIKNRLSFVSYFLLQLLMAVFSV